MMILAQTAAGVDLYVSPKGNDAWSGSTADANAEKTDGPLATVAAAVKKVRAAEKRGAFTIYLRAGTHVLAEPIHLTSDGLTVDVKLKDGRIKQMGKPLAFRPYQDEKPIVSGGRPITGFKEATFNGRKVWAVELPEVKAGKWYFRQLWINGERRYRAGIPGVGKFLKVHKAAKGPWTRGQDHFWYEGSQLAACKDLTDVEITLLNYWTSDVIPIKAIDHKTRQVQLAKANSWGSLEHARYRLENVAEAFSEPGTWLLRKDSGTLYYLPRKGEKPDDIEVIAPVLKTLLIIEGEEKRRIRNVKFEGITFSHNRADIPARQPGPSPQAAWPVGGAVTLSNVWGVTFTDCRIEHTGTYGLECLKNTRDVTVKRCTLSDLGAGGVKLWSATDRANIEDCDIGPGGMIFHSGCGVLIGRSNGNRIIHNRIHDFDYSGVSLGWNWGPGDNCFGNVVEWNRIENIGNGRQSDLAGIYFLGVQNGTRVRYNRIRNVTCAVYGGWGIYGDGWASGILIENNIITHTISGAFHTNVGINLELYNNIFAFNRNYQLTSDYPGAAHQMAIRRNIILADGQPMLNSPWFKMPAKAIDASNNLVWDMKAAEAGSKDKGIAAAVKLMGKGTVYADPKFADAKKDDFTLPADSPARKIGFVPLDLSGAGPRPRQ